MKNIICLLVDRLHIGSLGPYGNAEIETPTVDALAAESFLADRFYIDTTDVTLQCRSWWRGVHALARQDSQTGATPTIMARLNAAGYATVLITDDPAIAYSADANDFSDVQLLPVPESEIPCEEIERTHLCAMLATVAATAESLSQSGTPYLLWCQLRGFDGDWDFPLFLREKYRGEDDPEPYPGVTPPFSMKNETTEHWDDLRQSVVSAYAGGVTLFDELLEMLTEPLRSGDFGDETLFLMAGTRGILFGDGDMIGIPPYDLPQEKNDCDRTDDEQTIVEPLASSLVHVPLMARFPDGFGATVRSDTLLQPSDVTSLLCEWLEIPSPNDVQNAPNARFACRSMLDLIREEPQNLRECVVIVSNAGQEANAQTTTCLVTSSWLMQELASPEEEREISETAVQPFERYALYVKPDDRWDVNDVRDRCMEIAERLAAVKADLRRRLVDGDMSPLEPLPEELR